MLIVITVTIVIIVIIIIVNAVINQVTIVIIMGPAAVKGGV